MYFGILLFLSKIVSHHFLWFKRTVVVREVMKLMAFRVTVCFPLPDVEIGGSTLSISEARFL